MSKFFQSTHINASNYYKNGVLTPNLSQTNLQGQPSPGFTSFGGLGGIDLSYIMYIP